MAVHFSNGHIPISLHGAHMYRRQRKALDGAQGKQGAVPLKECRKGKMVDILPLAAAFVEI